MAEFSLSLAVIVGIDAYINGIPPLRTPVRDATALANLLRDHFGYEVWLRIDAQAGHESLRRLLYEELPGRLTDENTRLLFYFAGHGHAQEGDAYEGPVGYFFPQDACRDVASFLPMHKVFEALKVLPCRHFLAILDCCFAGAAFWDSSRDMVARPLKIWEERYLHFLRHPAWQVLTSCAHNERALDVPDGRVIGDRDETALHSPFAQALLEGLGGKADRYPDGGDGVITASELYAYLLSGLEAHQTPRFWPLRRHRQGEFVFHDLSRPLALPRAAEKILLDENANPYRGLQPYSRDHASLFFGRDAEIGRLQAQVERSRLIVVVGPSGSGKSSLVRAGLAPRFAGRQDGVWQVPPSISPGPDPFESLARALDSLAGPSAADLRAEEGSLRRWIESWLDQDAARHLVLIVDQLEELLTQARATGSDESASIPAESRSFLALLAAPVMGEGTALDRFHLILTVRSDFEPILLQGALAGPWRSARFSLRSMTPNELREVIEKPAAEKVLFFENQDLVDSLAQEVVQMPGALPLLSFTLSEMYRRYIHQGRGDRTLSVADYEDLGGVLGSLRKRANEEVERLDEKSREILQRILLRMVDNQAGELARRRVFLSEFRFPRDDDNRRVEEILDRLLEARLIARGSAPSLRTGREEPYVEPAHDKLITAWDQLLVWVREAGEDLALQRRVSQASEDWIGGKQDKDLLWTDDPRMPVLHGEHGLRRAFRRIRHPFRNNKPREPRPWLNQEELAFLAASHRAWQASQIRLWGTVAFLLAATIGTAWFFYQQNQVNLRLRLSGIVQRLAEQVPVALDQSNPDHNSQRALLLARQAYNVNSRQPLDSDLMGRVDDALRQVLSRSMPSEVVYRAQDFDPGPLAFSPAKSLLAAGLGAQVVLVDIQAQGASAAVLDPEVSSPVHGVGGTTTLAFDRLGRLVTGHALGYLCSWILRSPRKASSATCWRPLAEGSEILSVAFQPETSILVASLKSPQGGSRLQTWQWDGDPLRPLGDVPTKVPVKRLVVRKDGYIFGVGEASSTLFRWNLNTLAVPPIELAGDEGTAVHALALRSGGKDLLGVTSGLRVLWWRADPVQGGAEMPDLESAAALAPDPTSDRFILSDGNSMYWRGEGYFNLQMAKWMTGTDSGPTGLSVFISDKLRNDRKEISSYCHEATYDLVFSPDGRLLAVSCDRSIRLWRKSRSDWPLDETPSRVSLPSASALQVLFDPARSGRLAVARMDGSLDLWDLQQREFRSLTASSCRRTGDPAPAWFLAANLRPSSIVNLAWSAGGLSAFEKQGDLRTYSFSSPEPTCQTESLEAKVCVGELSDDGQWVAAVVEGPALAIMPRAKPRERRMLEENGLTVEPCLGAVAFHPREELLAGGVGTVLHSWSRDAGGAWRSKELAKVDGPIRSVAFRQDGGWLAAGGGTKGINGYIWLQDRREPTRSLPLLRIAQASVEKVEFSKQGDRIVGSDSSGRVYIWDLGHLERAPVVLHDKEQLSPPTLSADESQLAAIAQSEADSAIRIWDLNTFDLASAVCKTAAANLSWEDWVRFVGADEPYDRTCPKLPVHPTVLAEGDQRVIAGDVAGARRLFERVAKIEPERGLDPLRRIEAIQLRERLLASLQPDLSHLRIALRLFASADASILEQGIDPIRFQDIVNLCRWGALLADPHLALSVCDRAVELLEGDPEAHESRGIARALTGNLSGAAEDLSYASTRPGHEAWVRELRQGKNPLRRPEVIRALSKDLGAPLGR
jgi:WD40 repeat protein